jgi:hypothetical protein
MKPTIPPVTHPRGSLFPRRTVALATAFAAVACIHTAGAQSTWETIDDVPLAVANGITSDALGNMYIAGSIQLTTLTNRAIVLKSSDQGNSWDLNPATAGDDPSDSVSSTDGTNASFEGIASAVVMQNATSTRHLVTAGTANNKWIVRRSLDDGLTWATLDSFAPSKSYSSTYALKPAMDTAGTIYVPGSVTETVKGKAVTRSIIRKRAANSWTTLSVSFPVKRIICLGTTVFAVNDKPTNTAWEVRKSTDGGLNWTLVDTTVVGNVVADVAADSAGNLYVVGWDHRTVTTSYGRLTERYWITRKGTNGGTQWSEVDRFASPRTIVDLGSGSFAGVHSFPFDVAVDPQDNVYVTGVGVEDIEGRHWITRKLSTGASAFVTDDDYVITGTSDMNGTHIASGPTGNVFATGYISGTPVGVQGWVVRRKLATP